MTLWLFWTVACVLFLAAIVLFYWGLWSDRSKGRLRCPKCWYDMSGSFEAGKLVCPECGCDAATEKQLRKNHRRWPAIVLPLLLLLPHGYGAYTWYGWQCEQPAWVALRKVAGSSEVRWETVEPAPDWLVAGVPEPLRKYFDRINYVSIGFDRITDKELIHFRRLGYLREIEFLHTRITGPGLIHLCQLPRLKILRIINAPLTDEGLAYLKGFETLEELNLGGTDVTDGGLRQLYHLKHLRNLGLTRTYITGQGIVTARKMLPDCDVWQ